MTKEDSKEWGLIRSFYIDTDGYTARDREMFVAGYEYCSVMDFIAKNRRFNGPVNVENSSRYKMGIPKLGNFKITIKPQGDEFPTWHLLTVDEI